jgi:hypothetical protein
MAGLLLTYINDHEIDTPGGRYVETGGLVDEINKLGNDDGDDGE